MKVKSLCLILLALVLCACGPKASQDPSTSGIKDGEYTTSNKGYAGEFEVKTTIKGGKIASVVVDKHDETPNIGGAAIDVLTKQIVEKQAVNLDAITGATATSTALLKSVSDAIKQAGGSESDFQASMDVDQKDLVKEVDVVVVGGGGAGLSAAISAAQEGTKVLLIEKTGILGGNTIRAGGPFNAVNPEKQAHVEPASDLAMKSVYALTKIEPKNETHKKYIDQLVSELKEYDAGAKSHLFDSVALHILQTYGGGDFEGKIEFVEKLASKSLETLHWLEENGVQFKDEIATVPGGLWPRANVPIHSAGGDYIEANSKKATELGVEIMTNTDAKELLVKDNQVVGVKALHEGQPVTIHAKSVVLTTGGFSANKEMRQHYNPALVASLGTTNAPSIVGDGIKMAEAVGANLIGMEYIQCLPLGDPETGSLNGWMGGIGVEYYYQINKNGVRFMAEDGRRDDMTNSLLAQPDAFSYVITDTNRESDGTEVNIWGDNIEELVAKKKIFRADTIKELAEQIGVDPEVLQKTHDTFNSYVAQGADKDFGRKLFGDPIDKGPFYASPRIPTVHHTMGGLEIDLDGRVLNKDGKIIKGLYAAGEVTGGIHGKNRLGGNALVDIHVFGRSAGQAAAKDIK